MIYIYTLPGQRFNDVKAIRGDFCSYGQFSIAVSYKPFCHNVKSFVDDLIHLRQTSQRGFSRQSKRSQTDSSISPSIIQMVSFLPVITIGNNLVIVQLEIKESTDTVISALFPDLESEGRLRMKIYNNRDNFNFPYLYSNIPVTPEYGV